MYSKLFVSLEEIGACLFMYDLVLLRSQSFKNKLKK